MSNTLEQPLLFVEHHPDDRRKNKDSLNSALVKSHVAKSYRFPRINHSKSPQSDGISRRRQSSTFKSSLDRACAVGLHLDGDESRERKCRTPRAGGHPTHASLQPPMPYRSLPLFPDTFQDRQIERSMVFEYYIREWWPHGRQHGINSAVFGFTPILSLDHQLVNDRVMAALNYGSTLSIEAILAASSCRMQLVRNQPFTDPHLCELLYLQALSSLRKRLSMPLPVDGQLILDISALIYAEIFNKSGPPADVLWNICKEAIIRLGGLGQLPPMTALAALSTDLFVANAKLIQPALNPYHCPALLGMHSSDIAAAKGGFQALAASHISKLDLRCQAVIKMTNELGSQWTSLWILPSIHRTLQSLRTYRTRFAKNFRSPLSLLSSDVNTDVCIPAEVIDGDCCALRLKMTVFNTYLAYCSTTKEEGAAKSVADAPSWAREAITTILKSIDAINGLLHGTEWEVRQDHLLWTAVIGLFASESSVDRRGYRRLLGEVCSRLGITKFEDLMGELTQFLPLDRMQGYDEQLLYSVFTTIEVAAPEKVAG